MEVELPNLNPLNVLVYDIKAFEDKINEVDSVEVLDLCPRYKLTGPTLMYHFSEEEDKNFKHFGSKTKSILNYKGLTDFYFNFNDYIDYNFIHVLYNNDELNVLDLSFISAEIGVDIGVYFDNNTLNKYCVKHKLDGFIKLKRSVSYNIQCYTVDSTNFCPVLYCKDFTKIKMLGMIDTKKKDKYLDYEQISTLINILFCNIVKLIRTETDKAVSLTLTDQLFGKMIDTNYDLTDIYRGMYYNSFRLSFINLVNHCHDYLHEDLSYDHLPTDYLSTLKPIHYQSEPFYDKNDKLMTYYISDMLYRYILGLMAEDLKLQSFTYSHYDLFTSIPGYEGYTLEAIKNNGALSIIQYLEKDIINRLYQFYKQSEKSYQITLNKINIEYIPSTNNFIIKIIFDYLNKKPLSIAIKILSLSEVDKNIKNFFNADHMYHMIVNKKYNKVKLLYNDLTKDITNYLKNTNNIDLPSISYEYIKWLYRLTEEKKLTNFLQKMSQYLYDLYKGFIKDESGIVFDT